MLLVLSGLLWRIFAVLKAVHLAVNSNMEAAVKEIRAGKDELASIKQAALLEIKAELATLRLELSTRDRDNGYTERPRRRP